MLRRAETQCEQTANAKRWLWRKESNLVQYSGRYGRLSNLYRHHAHAKTGSSERDDKRAESNSKRLVPSRRAHQSHAERERKHTPKRESDAKGRIWQQQHKKTPSLTREELYFGGANESREKKWRRANEGPIMISVSSLDAPIANHMTRGRR